MVRWRGRRQSRQVEDRRGASLAGAGVLAAAVRLIVSRFGLGGLVVLGVVGAGLYMAGVDPRGLFQAQGPGASPTAPGSDDETGQFVRVIVAQTEDVWSQIFSERGREYSEPTLVLFSDGVSSACGLASAAAGPFYCPSDRKVYLDTSFFRELSDRFGAPGDFAAAYVIAHEIGHHVQTLTGVADRVRAAQQQANETDANLLQVRMELQADCYAGLWARRANRSGNFLEAGDIEEGLRAAAAIGDDTLQRNAGRRVTPESFTHGSSEQRARWFLTGYRSGDVAACDTFAAP